jgi:DNA-binding protein HU-beta
MNKAQLIDAMASKSGLSKNDSKKALEAFVDSVSGALKGGDRIQLVGFGSFSVAERSARTGRNPRTGEEINIPAKKVVKFKAGNDLAEEVS